MSTNLTGLHLITGGTSGIGFAIATEVVKKGYNVILGYNSNDNRAHESKRKLLKINANCNITLVKGNIAEDETIESYIGAINECIKTKNVKLIGVTHVAGGGGKDFPIPGSVNFNSETQMECMSYYIRIYGMQLLKLFEKCKDIMIRNNNKLHNGSFVFISSPGCNVNAINPPSWYLGPGSGKTLGEFYCRMYARQFAKYKINVNCVIPGLIRTDAWKTIENGEILLRELTKKTPMGRYAEPEEVGYLVDFLLSSKAAYITGTNIVLDGGNHLGQLGTYPDDAMTSKL